MANQMTIGVPKELHGDAKASVNGLLQKID